MKQNLRSIGLRRRFLIEFWSMLGVVWPIMSGLVGAQLALGALVSILERWPIVDALYFTFVTGLTIGYGDLTPKRFLSRLIAIVIGFIGILFVGLVSAISVRALQAIAAKPAEPPGSIKPLGSEWN